MRLIDLDIQRMPGFERAGFSYQGLSSGVHVVWGPNGSGKSTTCLALKALLWPEDAGALHPVLVQSTWEQNGEKICLAREGMKSAIPRECKEKLQTCSSHAYFFSLDDLFQRREKELARLLWHEMHGGYDLSVLWEKWEISPRFGAHEASQLGVLRREFEKTCREQNRNGENEEVECAGECLKLKMAIDGVLLEESRMAKPRFPLEGALLLAASLVLLPFLWFLALLAALFAGFFFQRFLKAKKRFQETKLALQQKRSELLSKVEIEKEVQRALSSRQFDEARQKVQIAKDAFEKKQARAAEILLGRAFLKRIEEQFEKEQQTLILQRASHYLEQFSLGLYSIEDIVQDKIRLWDAKRECPIEPEKLSYGFQIQLLLALRVGFLSLSEDPTFRLPLFLDEVLLHIDDDRFARVAEALLEIGKERQVFIFTCQRAHFEVWRNYPVTLIDLEELQGKKQAARAPITRAPKSLVREPLPEEDKVSYALALGLSSLDFNLALASQPAWIILPSAQEIYRMQKLGVKTVGHLLTLPCGDEIQKNYKILKTALALFAVGRTRLINRLDLEKAVEQGMFSSTFLDALDECSKKNGREAKQLLEALKKKSVKRFLERYIENLEKYFQEQGLLDLRPTLTEEEIRKQLYADSPESLETIELILNVANKSLDMSQSSS